MGFYAQYPASSGGSANASVGANGATAPTSSTEIGYIDGSGNLQPVSTAAPLPVHDSAPVTPAGSATSANQVLEITQLTGIHNDTTSIDTKTPALVAGKVPVNISATNGNILTAGNVAGALDVFVNNSSIQVIGTGANGTAATAGTLLISGSDAGTQRNVAVDATGAVKISSTGSGLATEATLAAFSAKTAGALVPQAFDYQTITYVGATTDINTVVFKTGGAGGATVATLTMGYDGSNRLSSVTRS